MQRSFSLRLLFAFTLMVGGMGAGSITAAAPTYATLREGDVMHGFRAVASYRDNADRPMGARFVHARTGFTLDLLEIQSVPQAFTWVTTFPTSDMGEPHTQEHLLLAKGNQGRARANAEPMRLVNSSAFTMQWRTIYHFHSTAGTDAFFAEFEQSYDAFLHPDYSDEEIRREVRNFGVNHASDQSLQLEEQGTVYNEMVTSMDLAGWRMWKTAGRTVYGADHPLAFNAGGSPEALRVLQPQDIRDFHAAHYFLGNMGTVMGLGRDVALPDALARIDAIFGRLEPTAVAKPTRSEADLPPPQPAPAGSITYVDYPFRDDQQPGDVALLWPAERDLDPQDFILCELFLANLASDPTSNLYKRFIDSRTREYELGAQSVSAGVDRELGSPVSIWFSDVPVARRNDADLADLRTRVVAELARIAAWSDGSTELHEFNARLQNRLVERRRAAAKFVNSPPGFGFRGTRAEWMERLDELSRTPGFAKSITQKPELDAIAALVASGHNVWRERLAAWRLLEAEPYILAARPNPELVKIEQEARGRRIAAEIARLAQRYTVDEPQAVLRNYQQEFAANTAAIEAAGRGLTPPAFIANPPLTLDDQLDFKVTTLAGRVPLVTSTFDSMTSGYVGLALRLDGVPEEQLGLLAMLPDLLTEVGVIENGQPVSFEEMSERLRQEILGLEARFRTDLRTGRVELIVRGAGNDIAETLRALAWMRLVLEHPDWRPENLARLRDLADQTFVALRNTMQRREEAWVQDPAAAYRMQANPVFLSVASFLTRAHHVFRLRWMLKDPGLSVVERAAVSTIMRDLATARGTRDELKARLVTLNEDSDQAQPAGVRTILADARKDLELVLADVPDASLATDWTYLCDRMRADFETGPERTLQALEALRRSLLRASGARMFAIAATATQKEIAPAVTALATSLDPAGFESVTYRPGRRIDERLRARDPAAVAPRFVGLLNANSQGGVFLNSAPATSYLDTDEDALLDYLATNLYGGGGAHGIFMKTWAAGLAYSNGIGSSPSRGLLSYYAERTPELPVTLKFVIDTLKNAEPDPALVEYAIAGAFGSSRAGGSYESRGEAIAADLADGLAPEVISRFRRAILALRDRPDLLEQLYARANGVYARVLPGMSADVANVPDSVYLVIGPEKQFTAYEAYLKSVVAPESQLHRLFPRDFWLTE